MGNNLTTVDVGTGFDVMGIDHGRGGQHHCVYGKADGEYAAKCWGRNRLGQLGYGDTQVRGEEANQMGDYLPFLDMVITVAASEPTAKPTPAPTASPTAPTPEP